jgi:hypothetical protein
VDVKAEHFERQVQRVEQERDVWEKKYEVRTFRLRPAVERANPDHPLSFQDAQAKYQQSAKELDELVRTMVCLIVLFVSEELSLIFVPPPIGGYLNVLLFSFVDPFLLLLVHTSLHTVAFGLMRTFNDNLFYPNFINVHQQLYVTCADTTVMISLPLAYLSAVLASFSFPKLSETLFTQWRSSAGIPSPLLSIITWR